MSSHSSKMEAVHPLLRFQFEDLCHSVGDHCASLLASVLEGCIYISETIRTETDSQTQSMAKLYFSNILNDVHYNCLKHLELVSRFFFETAQIEKSTVDKSSNENIKIIHGLLWRPIQPKEKNSSELAEPGSKCEKKVELPQDLSLSQSDKILKSTSSYVERYQNFLEQRANSSLPLNVNENKSNNVEAIGKPVKYNVFRKLDKDTDSFDPMAMHRYKLHADYNSFDLFKKSPASIIRDKLPIDK